MENIKHWLNKLLSINFKGKHIILSQLNACETDYSCEWEYCSVEFILKGEVRKYPYKTNVPVIMDAFQKNSAPISFILHLKDGIIDELEVLILDGGRIHPESIEMDNVEYHVSKAVYLPNQPSKDLIVKCDR